MVLKTTNFVCRAACRKNVGSIISVDSPVVTQSAGRADSTADTIPVLQPSLVYAADKTNLCSQCQRQKRFWTICTLSQNVPKFLPSSTPTVKEKVWGWWVMRYQVSEGKVLWEYIWSLNFAGVSFVIQQKNTIWYICLTYRVIHNEWYKRFF